MSSIQRLAVWNGDREKTTGGLRKGDLVKNRHGRLVSKKKSAIARKLNNLGSYLAGAKGNRKGGRKKDSKDAAASQAEKTEKVEKHTKKPAKRRRTPKDAAASQAETTEKVEKHKKKPAKRRRNPKDGVDKMVQDPEVKAKRKKILKRKTQVSADVDVANIIPKIPKLEAKTVPRRTGRRRKKVDYSKMGGTLITSKQLKKAKRKAIPKRRRKKKKNVDPILDTIHI